jgi:lipoate---protein ligase
MELFISPITDPMLNLGLESYFLDVFEGEGCLVYRDAPSVIIGKNQNPYREVDVAFCKQNSLPVLRRISGGGAVFHDPGNINTAFFGKRAGIADNLYHRWTEPPLRFLNCLGILAERDGRNGLEVLGKKISGSAQALKKDRFLHHATLLYSSDLEVLSRCLQTVPGMVEGQGVASHRSPVVNLGALMEKPTEVESFQNAWVEFLLKYLGIKKLSSIPLQAGLHAQEQTEKQYKHWEWNVGRSPRFQFRQKIGERCLVIEIHKGLIEGITWESDVGKEACYESLQGKLFSLEALEGTDFLKQNPQLANLIF